MPSTRRPNTMEFKGLTYFLRHGPIMYAVRIDNGRSLILTKSCSLLLLFLALSVSHASRLLLNSFIELVNLSYLFTKTMSKSLRWLVSTSIKQWASCIVFVFCFLLHPIDNTLVVQYQLVQGWLNYVYIIKKKKERKLEWRRAHYRKLIVAL